MRAGGTDQSFSEGDFISGIKNDVQGNIFALGSFTQNADFGPFTLAGNANYSQLFLAKLNPAGVFQWVVSTSGPGRVFTEHIEMDSSSNVYITAQFQADTVYLQGDTLIPLNVQLPQILIAKFDMNGNKIWTRTFQNLYANENCFIKPRSNNKLFFCFIEGNIYPSLSDLKVGTLNINDESVLTVQDIANFKGNIGGMTVNKDNKTII